MFNSRRSNIKQDRFYISKRVDKNAEKLAMRIFIVILQVEHQNALEYGPSVV